VVDESPIIEPVEELQPQDEAGLPLELEAEPETQAERDAPSLPAIEFELESADLPLPELVEESAPDALPELPDEVAEPVALEAEEPTDAVETVETLEPTDTVPLAAESATELDPLLLRIRTATHCHISQSNGILDKCHRKVPQPLSDALQRPPNSLKGSENMAGIQPVAALVTPLEKLAKDFKTNLNPADQAVAELF